MELESTSVQIKYIPFYCCDNDSSNDKAQWRHHSWCYLYLTWPSSFRQCLHLFNANTCSRSPPHPLALLDLTGRLSPCGPKFNLLLIFRFDKTQTDLREKQLVINPMGMLTVSSGMPLSLQSSRNGSGPKRLTENLGEKAATVVFFFSF